MIRLKNITKTFPDGTTALNGINLEISSQKFVVLFGPSGSGKSTLLRLIAGLDSPDQGDIYFGDRQVTNLPAKRRNVAMVFQNYALYPHFTVAQNIGYPLKINRVSTAKISQKVAEIADLLGIADLLQRYPKEISGGQKQRVAMGRCLIRDPDIFLFDEPLSNLDARLRETLRREIVKLHQGHKCTSIYVTHDQQEAMALGELLVVLNKGTVQQIGKPQEVYEQPANLFSAEFVGYPAVNKILGSFSADGWFCLANGKQVVKLDFAQLKTSFTGPAYGCIRPEKITVAPLMQTGQNARLKYIEYLGSKSLLEFDYHGFTILVETPAAKFSVDLEYSLSLSADDFLWFDKAGNRLFGNL